MLYKAHKRLQRIIQPLSIGLLFLFAAAAPHSIAGAQGCALALALLWLLEWLLRSAGAPRNALPQPAARWASDWWPPLGVFFALCTVSALRSYEPLVSLDGLRSVAFMAASGVVAHWVTTRAQAWRLACVLLASSQVGLLYTGYQLVVGVGIRLVELAPDSPLRPYFQPGDVLLQVDGRLVHRPDDIVRALHRRAPSSDQPVHLTGRRVELPLTAQLDRRALNERLERFGAAGLGIQVSEPARDFRASGFFSHYVTYAEVLQILISLAVGMAWRAPRPVRRWLWAAAGLLLLALWLTLSRGPVGGLIVSVGVMLYLLWREGTLRTQRVVVGFVIAGILLAGVLAYAYALRRMAVADVREGSLFWRLVVWQEGVQLAAEHPWFGVGRLSDKLHAAEWGLYAAGDLPPGHFHNTYLQIAVWYGLPALAAYLWLLLTYFERLLERIRDGVALGALGALAGFAVGGVAHFNLGDGEVAMALWFVLGLALGPREIASPATTEERPPVARTVSSSQCFT
ncbi:MAG: O-antigen ligase family protein [Chloracidobacterium sp.]|nr:O-antigen ligase family protein [Chloracidobacterium sp.]MDW8217078.1 O-antigen ligase family protein [Acidobacteriota bacterium]